jgi:hypothetical protein
LGMTPPSICNFEESSAQLSGFRWTPTPTLACYTFTGACQRS